MAEGRWTQANSWEWKEPCAGWQGRGSKSKEPRAGLENDCRKTGQESEGGPSMGLEEKQERAKGSPESDEQHSRPCRDMRGQQEIYLQRNEHRRLTSHQQHQTLEDTKEYCQVPKESDMDQEF